MPSHLKIKTLLLLGVFALVSTPSFARGYVPTATPTPKGFNITYPTASTAAANLAPASLGGVIVTGTAAAVATDFAVSVATTGLISAAASAGAIGVAFAAVGIGALYALPAIKAWMDRASVRPGLNGTILAKDPGVCTVAPCYAYSNNVGGQFITEQFSTRDGACSAVIANLNKDASSNGYYSYSGSVNSSNRCVITDGRDGTFMASTDVFQVAPATTVPYKTTNITETVKLLGQASPTPEAVQELVDLNFPPVVAPQSTTGPASTSPANTVKLGLDGSRSTETCAYFLEYFPSNIAAHPECTTTVSTPAKTDTKQVLTTNPDGTTSTQTITTTTPASTSTATISKDTLPEAKACGLPGSPPCRIDEAGTPAAPNLDPSKTALDIYAPLKRAAENPVDYLPKLPVLNWAFQLPSGCTALAIPAFSPFLQAIDICGFVPMFHDIMSIVWILGGLFGAIGTFWRNTFAQT